MQPISRVLKNDTKLKEKFVKRKDPIKVAIWMANRICNRSRDFKKKWHQVKTKFYKEKGLQKHTDKVAFEWQTNMQPISRLKKKMKPS